jgi:Flp pilus assembly protein TadG
MKYITNRLLSPLKSEEGSIFVLLAVAMFLLIIVVGVAVDMARGQALQARLASAVDAAALAVGAAGGGSSGSQQAEATKYFTVNLPAGYLNSAPINTPTLTVTTQDNITTYAVNAQTPQYTSFLNAIGVKSVQVAANTTVQRTVSGIELALVIDNTESMSQPPCGGCGGSKIEDAKSAACTLVTTLYGGNGDPLNACGTPTSQITQQGLWISLVPFTGMVNIGNPPPFVGGKSAWEDPNDPGPNQWVSPESWAGCVMARPTVPQPIPTNAPPWGAAYDENDTPPTAGQSGSFFDEFWDPYPFNSNNHNEYCGSPLSPMLGANKGDEKIILSNIAAMAIPAKDGPNEGDTEINLGAAWGFRLLSPNWTGFWGGEMASATPQLPLSYSQPANTKVMILLTDGEDVFNLNTPLNNHLYSYIAYGALNCYKNSGIPQPGCTPLYDPVNDNNPFAISPLTLGNSYSTTDAKHALDARAIWTATVMKNPPSPGNPVVIYTIGFGKQGQIDLDLLGTMATNGQGASSCTSTGPFCFAVPDNTTLQATFQNIANQLQNLRVSQ